MGILLLATSIEWTAPAPSDVASEAAVTADVTADVAVVDNSDDMVLVTDGGFWIDTHEVTNAAYAAFVEATSHRPPSYVDNGPRVWNKWVGGAPPVGYEHHPVVGVDWWDAEAYCAWSGKHRRRRSGSGRAVAS